MFTPFDARELEYTNARVNEYIEKCDELFKENHGIESYELAVIDECLPEYTRNAICVKYTDCGWAYVYHAVDTELNQTIFILSMKRLKHSYRRGFHEFKQTYPDF